MNGLVKRFKALNLVEGSEDQIKELVAEIGNIPIMEYSFNYKLIYRARANNNENDDFEKISDLSYKPQQNNRSYQRASTPNATMFYGTLIPEGDDGLVDERTIGAFEIVGFLRDMDFNSEDEQVVTYGIWRALAPVSTYSVIRSNIKQIKIDKLKKAAERFKHDIKKHPRFKNTIWPLQNFIAGEFSKDIPKGKDQHYNYMISAIFSERACQRGLDGVLYPSVKMKGWGLNVALTPECVDSKLVLDSAIKCKIYKKFKKVILNNLKTGIVDQETGTITWEDLPIGEYRRTEEDIREELSRVVLEIIIKGKHKRKKSKKKKALKLMKKRAKKNLNRKRKMN